MWAGLEFLKAYFLVFILPMACLLITFRVIAWANEKSGFMSTKELFWTLTALTGIALITYLPWEAVHRDTENLHSLGYGFVLFPPSKNNCDTICNLQLLFGEFIIWGLCVNGMHKQLGLEPN